MTIEQNAEFEEVSNQLLAEEKTTEALKSGRVADDRNDDDASKEESGLAYEDAWDKPGAVQQAQQIEDADPFAQHRRAAAHQLEVPTSAMSFGSEGWDESVQADYAIASRASGFSQELAQSLLNEATNVARAGNEHAFRLPDGSYDTNKVTGALRHEWGDGFTENLTRISKFVHSKAALRDFLDSSGLGDSPAVLRVLNGIAHDPSILDPAKAQALIDRVKRDPTHSYWSGEDKTAIAHMRAAYMVVEAARRRSK